MNTISYLVPARFLALVSQLVIAIMILLSRNANVENSLTASFTTDEYKQVDVELFIALSLTLVLIIWEFLGFISGTTMFINFQSLLSTIAHVCGLVASIYFVFEVWPVSWYWYIFGFCNVIPALTEFIYILQVHCFHRGF